MLQQFTYIFDFFQFFHSRQGEACKDKIVPHKTPRRLTLCGVRPRTVLAKFGFSKNIRNFSKYYQMDPKFHGNGDFRKSKNFALFCAVLACAESDSAQCQPAQWAESNSAQCQPILDLQTFQNIVGYCTMSIFIVATPFRHRYLYLFVSDLPLDQRRTAHF